MDSWWAALKAAFGGILNLGMAVGLVIGVLVYAAFFAVVTYFENKEHTMTILAWVQLWLGGYKNKWTRRMARKLWASIMRVDSEWRSQVARDPINGDLARCTAFWNLSQVEGGDSVERALRAIEDTLSEPGTSQALIKVGNVVLRELQERQRSKKALASRVTTGAPGN